MADAPPLPHPTKRNLVWLMLQAFIRLTGLVFWGVGIRGTENLPKGGALLLFNHQSFLDPIVFGAQLRRPVSYLARDTLFNVFFIGWILRKTYVMPINRESGGTESIRNATRRMQHGFLVGIFPEGTRTEDGTVGEFKPGFISLVRRGKVPVIPVGIAGAFQAYSRKAIFPRPGPRVSIVIGDPLPDDELSQLTKKGHEDELVTVARQRVIECQQEAEEWRLSRTWFRRKPTVDAPVDS